MVKRKMKITTKEETLRKIDRTRHPNYDEVVKKMRKLLGAASSFIPEACEALRLDWYPELSQEQIKHDKEARDDIREKMFEDWSYERNDNQGAWGDIRIQYCLPDWLKNPNQQTADYLEKAAANLQTAYLAKKSRLASIEIEAQKPAIERLVNKLPEPVILPEEIPEPQLLDEPEGSDEPLDAATIREISIHGHDTELTAAEQTILKALKNKEHLRHVFNEIASGSSSNLAKLSINGHIERLDKIRSLVDNALTILQDIRV